MGTGLKVNKIVYKGQSLKSNHQGLLLSISLPTTIKKGIIDSITVEYEGEPENSMVGFGSFIHSKHNDVPVIWTLSEPFGARDWWPCKMGGRDKVDSLDVVIVSPSPNRGVSNGMKVYEKKVGNNNEVHWKHRYPITSYLICLAVTNYVDYSDYLKYGDKDSMMVLNYVYPEGYDYAKESTPKVLPIIDLYNRLFIDYPFRKEKYGHAQFGWGGGMEHQTMSFMVNFDPGLMAHELSHQWFGNYVTCTNFQEIWINEGFATYVEGLAHEHNLVNGSFFDWLEGKISHVTSQDGGSVFVPDTTDIWRIFDGRLSYSKGGVVLHTLRWEIGDSAFFGAIRNFLNDPKHAYGYATTQDIMHHFEKTSGRNLSEFFKDWIYGEGFPKFEIYWAQTKDNKIKISVKQQPSHQSVDFYEMHLPIKIAGNNKDTMIRLNLTKPGETFELPLNFVVEAVVFDPQKWIITSNPKIYNYSVTKDTDTISISPNPGNEFINVNTSKMIKFSKIEILDTHGKSVQTFSPTGFNTSFSLKIEKLVPGNYLLRLVTKTDEHIFRFIKK